jgi:phage-related protein
VSDAAATRHCTESGSTGRQTPLRQGLEGRRPVRLEIVSDFDGDTFRGVYTVKFRKASYVLHCFQKKSPGGIKTAQVDMDLITRRLKAARDDYEGRYGKTRS